MGFYHPIIENMKGEKEMGLNEFTRWDVKNWLDKHTNACSQEMHKFILQMYDELHPQVETPVSFLEALKAYEEDKTIKCAVTGYTRTYTPQNKGLTDNMGAYITANEILNGQWYIL